MSKFDEAIAGYIRIYELSGDPPMLYNIGQSYRLSNRPEQAIRFYRRYLQRAPGASNRDDVEAKISTLEQAIQQKTTSPAPQPPQNQ